MNTLPVVGESAINETSGAGPHEMLSSRNDTPSGPDSTGNLHLYFV